MNDQWQQRSFINQYVLAMVGVVTLVGGAGLWVGAKASELSTAISKADQLSIRLDQVENLFDQQFGTLNRRIGTIEGQFDGLSRQMENVQGQLSTLTTSDQQIQLLLQRLLEKYEGNSAPANTGLVPDDAE